ncbi:MAG: long-chain fatty acid--CoA ligase [Proteobacteria bacterium]|nr:long-chain fatty acid--CoA ligase [Pseudomonadota bacterium]
MTVSRSAIEAELLEWMGSRDWRTDDPRFERIALDLFAFQFEACAPYSRYCTSLGASPATVRSWREIPAVPTGAFKELPLRCFPEQDVRVVFRTSGTSTERRGELSLDDPAIYEASLLPTLRRFLFPKLEPDQRTTIRLLAPSPGEAPDSSLSYMFGHALDTLGDAHSGYDSIGGVLQTKTLRDALELACSQGRPVALCGTAFSFVHCIDELARTGDAFDLPEGSRVMETGGFKGRSREISRDELYGWIGEQLGVATDSIVNQYGMTELGSQFYDSVLNEPGRPRRKLGPPWARVRIVDPETGRDAGPGEAGMIAIHDLANTGSVAAILTADLGRTVADGFEVLGRAPGAEARGCSIAADAMLGEAG